MRRIEGPAAPLLLDDINTDVIIPTDASLTRDTAALAAGAFRALRGPDFVLERPHFRGAPILVAGRNFGCGSSREAAVWALQALGIRCVVAGSFGEIFSGNAVKNGLLLVPLQASELERIGLLEGDERAAVVDLEEEFVTGPKGETAAFAIEPGARRRLLAGLDPIDAALERLPDIVEFQKADRLRHPWNYLSPPVRSVPPN